MRFAPFAWSLLAAFALPAAAVTIDGHIQPGEWQGARHITDFRQTQPLTGKPAIYPVQAWILATPKGLAVAMRVSQPPGVPRTEQHVQHDFREEVDRVNIDVDFTGSGRTGYNFTVASTGAIDDEVITNETHSSSDWDGIWQHAVSQDAQGWTAEVLIPWYTAPMSSAVNGKRTISVYLDRVIGVLGLRAAWPVASYSNPRFLSDFTPIRVPAYHQSLLAVSPYVSGTYDAVHGSDRLREGADIFWKPDSRFQLTATLNPDFGEVESDDLVVNFGAIETFFSDKRAFFTENHGIFDFSLLDDNSQLVYSRRVGGPADDGDGASDISAAVKLNGSAGATRYGALVAQERGAAGRFFSAARVVHDFGDQNLGLLLTRVEHPFLDRDATVLGIDDHWRPNAEWTIAGNVIGSDIVQHDLRTRGAGATFLADYQPGGGWTSEWAGMHFDDKLQVNDFGYLSRNDFDYLHWEVRKRTTDLPSDSRYSSHEWQFRIDGLNSDDEQLRLRRELRISRDSQLRSGGQENIELDIDSAGWDDLLTRDHGALLLPPSFSLNLRESSPRHGDWAIDSNFSISSGGSAGNGTSAGLSGNREIGYDLEFTPTLYVSNTFNVTVGLEYQYLPDWLVWQHDNLVGRFRQRMLELDSGFFWSISARQELRLKLQAIGLDAHSRGGYLVGADGHARPATEPVGDFSVRDFGVQLRYRYELAPLSYLYVVYGRGGFLEVPQPGAAFDLFRRSFALRQEAQWLVKLNYRLDL
ncbi:MAG TPA: DUF5916 domain-containing protein [Rhodanobacteraceae bacterium]|nr:DUF5916 domain-containing protein [Rhodanobacteraceae bacterium]